MKSQHVVVLGLHIRTRFRPGLSGGDVTETDRESALSEESSDEVHVVMSALCLLLCCDSAAAVLKRPIRPLRPHCCTVSSTVQYSTASHLSQENPGWFEILILGRTIN